MSMGQGTRSRLVRRDVLELQTPQFYFAPGDTNVFTGPKRGLAEPPDRFGIVLLQALVAAGVEGAEASLSFGVSLLSGSAVPLGGFQRSEVAMPLPWS